MRARGSNLLARLLPRHVKSHRMLLGNIISPTARAVPGAVPGGGEANHTSFAETRRLDWPQAVSAVGCRWWTYVDSGLDRDSRTDSQVARVHPIFPTRSGPRAKLYSASDRV